MPFFLKRLQRDERGGTAIEYGLIAALIVIASIGAFDALANENTGVWGKVNTQVVDSSTKARNGK